MSIAAFRVTEECQPTQDGQTRKPISGEGYPYHLIRSWSWHQPHDSPWHVVLTFGDDQKGYKLEVRPIHRLHRCTCSVFQPKGRTKGHAQQNGP